MDKAHIILAGDKGICLKYRQTLGGKWAAALVNRGTGATVATGFGRRKEQAYEALQDEIVRRAPDLLAHCQTKNTIPKE